MQVQSSTSLGSKSVAQLIGPLQAHGSCCLCPLRHAGLRPTRRRVNSSQGQRPCRGLRPQSAPTFYRVSQGLDEWVAVFMEFWGKNWWEMLVDL